MVVTTQALLSLWPFLKRMIFGDREVKEVLRENKYITFMLICILMLLSTVVWVGNELDAVKAENRVIVRELEDLKATQAAPDIDDRRRRLDELLR